MSVPVRYSATSGILDNNNSIDDQSEAQEEMRLQRMPIGVRLGTPDAATVPLGNADDNGSELLNPSTEELFAKLNETLLLEIKYQPCLYLPQEAQVKTTAQYTKSARLYNLIFLFFFCLAW